MVLHCHCPSLAFIVTIRVDWQGQAYHPDRPASCMSSVWWAMLWLPSASEVQGRQLGGNVVAAHHSYSGTIACPLTEQESTLTPCHPIVASSLTTPCLPGGRGSVTKGWLQGDKGFLKAGAEPSQRPLSKEEVPRSPTGKKPVSLGRIDRPLLAGDAHPDHLYRFRCTCASSITHQQPEPRH